ncbi:ABC transporter ATP-binding protein [Paucibacter sp. M5-1]|uniref:ABC transporter ATP-binding protein n=1 Tax=Paucibacter sp. M5-1 TaxID=3015998 RepID=UPI003F7FFE64
MPSLKELRELRSALMVLCEGLDRSMAWRLAGANALALLGGVLAGLAPLALKELIDVVSRQPSDTNNRATEPWAWISALGIVYLLCLSAARLASEIRPFLVGGVEQRLYTGLRVRYFTHLLDLPLSFHLARQSGAMGQRLQQAVSGYQLILASLVHGFIPVLVEGVTVAIVLLTLGQPALAATFVLTGIALALAVGRHMPQLRISARAVTGSMVDLQGLMADSLINYEPIKCFGAERETLNRFGEQCLALETHWRDLLHRRLAIGASVTMVFTLSVASSLAIALLAVSQGRLSLGGFVLATLYMVQIIRPLELLSSAARDASQGLAFLRPLLEDLGISPGTPPQPPRVQQGNSGGEPASAMHTMSAKGMAMASPVQAGVAVSFRGVCLAYDRGPPVLRDFSLDVSPGKSLAIVGASGCGKSSLVRLLLRLQEPDAGAITLAGTRIDAIPVDELRSMIAVVPQDLALLNGTVAANIALGMGSATRASIANAARLAKLHDFVAALPCGYETVIGERGLKLSGGERQRIAIARAILRRPRLFILDEATSMLDAHTEQEIMQNLLALSQGRTLILIAHRLATIRHADDIAVLAGGAVVERGAHATLMALGGTYAAMWQHQTAAERRC